MLIEIRDEYVSGTYHIRIDGKEYCYIRDRELTYILPKLLKKLGYTVKYNRIEE
jgi:hypothetical protein